MVPYLIHKVFPARAGMIPRRPTISMRSYGIPRESGDDPELDEEEAQSIMYSPRERG